MKTFQKLFIYPDKGDSLNALRRFFVHLGMTIGCLIIPALLHGQNHQAALPRLPLDMATLKKALSYARGPGPDNLHWPRTIQFDHAIYDFSEDMLRREKKVFVMKHKPLRIIPHGVGVSEILWAICPRERIVAFSELAADPKWSFLADEVRPRFPLFNSKQTERIIGYRPDLVFTVFFSEATFKEKLKQAGIPFFDLGYFGTIESIQQQILLVGKIIGEDGNAADLVRVMNHNIEMLQKKIPADAKPKNVLFFDEGGYVPGETSNFNSICRIIRVINVGARQGIKSWSRIDYETLLQWDPEIIVVPRGSHLRAQLTASALLNHARAIKTNRVHEIPAVYLNAGSQYMVLSANLLAGIVYENNF